MNDEAARPQWATQLVRIAMFTVVYVGVGLLSLGFSFRHGSETLIWLPGGVSLAAMILFGPGLWPGLLVGAFLLGEVQGLTPLLGLSVAAATTLEAVFGAVVLTRFVDFRPSLDRISDVLALLLVGGVVGSSIGAILEVAPLWLAGYFESKGFASIYMLWWRAGFAHVVTIAPILLLLRWGSPDWSALFANKQFWAVAGLLAATCLLAFGGVATGEFQALTAYLPLMLVIWAGATLGSRGAILITFATFATVQTATAHGLGPFVTPYKSTTLSLVWIYCMWIASTGPIVAAAVSQRKAAELQSRRDADERMRAEQDGLMLRQRQRIMREMHDGLGGQLVSLLSMVQRGHARNEEVAEGLRRVVDDMRIMIDSLEPSPEGLTGVLGKFRARMEPMLRRNGLELSWKVDDSSTLELIGPTQILHCVRILQEAVANVIQHAQARHVQIAIVATDSEGSMLSIEVRDDGIGGPVETTTTGRGMRNMKERAHEIGAEIRFEATRPGRRVLVLIPTPRGLV